MRTVIISILLVTFAVSALAQSGSGQAQHILSFANWKNQQITEADNRAVRLANKIKLMKDAGITNSNEISKIDMECRVAKNAALVVRDLTIEDYFNVYLSQFVRDSNTLEAAAHNLTPQEVTLLLKMYLNAHEPSDQASNL